MAQSTSMEEFEALLNESFEMDTPSEGSVVKGRVIAVEAGQAIIDVGYKMEGRVDLKEFADPGEAPEVNVGDSVEVFLRQVENSKGEAVISREMARRERHGTASRRLILMIRALKAQSLAASKVALP